MRYASLCLYPGAWIIVSPLPPRFLKRDASSFDICLMHGTRCSQAYNNGCCNFMRVSSLNWNYGMCSARYWPNLVVHLAAKNTRKMRLASESAEEEETRLSRRRYDNPDAKVETERSVPYSLRRRRKIVAALKLPRPESVQTEIEERGVSIQKARRKMTRYR